MKNKIISIIQALVLLWGVTSCHSPEELGSDIQREGINSITASFPNDDSSENSFKGEIDYTNHSSHLFSHTIIPNCRIMYCRPLH